MTGRQARPPLSTLRASTAASGRAAPSSGAGIEDGQAERGPEPLPGGTAIGRSPGPLSVPGPASIRRSRSRPAAKPTPFGSAMLPRSRSAGAVRNAEGPGSSRRQGRGTAALRSARCRGIDWFRSGGNGRGRPHCPRGRGGCRCRSAGRAARRESSSSVRPPGRSPRAGAPRALPASARSRAAARPARPAPTTWTRLTVRPRARQRAPSQALPSRSTVERSTRRVALDPPEQALVWTHHHQCRHQAQARMAARSRPRQPRTQRAPRRRGARAPSGRPGSVATRVGSAATPARLDRRSSGR